MCICDYLYPYIPPTSTVISSRGSPSNDNANVKIISAVTNPLAELVLKKLDELRGCDAHFSIILSEEDTKLYNRLGIHVSCEPKYEIQKLYHK